MKALIAVACFAAFAFFVVYLASALETEPLIEQVENTDHHNAVTWH